MVTDNDFLYQTLFEWTSITVFNCVVPSIASTSSPYIQYMRWSWHRSTYINRLKDRLLGTGLNVLKLLWNQLCPKNRSLLLGILQDRLAYQVLIFQQQSCNILYLYIIYRCIDHKKKSIFFIINRKRRREERYFG